MITKNNIKSLLIVIFFVGLCTLVLIHKKKATEITPAAVEVQSDQEPVMDLEHINLEDYIASSDREAKPFMPSLDSLMPIENLSNDNEFCFANYYLSKWNDGSFNLDSGGEARIKITNGKTSGYFQFLVGDGWYATVSGDAGKYDPVTKSRVINGAMEIESEGSKSETKVKITLNGEKNSVEFQMNLDGIMDTGGEQTYGFGAVSCEDLTEWNGVFNKLWENYNIGLNVMIIDYAHNKGVIPVQTPPTVKFKNFTYTTDDNHNVTGVKLEQQ